MIDLLKPTTPVFVAFDDRHRAKVYHLYRSYTYVRYGSHAPACNSHLSCYSTDVESAEAEGLRLCGHCQKLLAMLGPGEIRLEGI